MHVNRYLHRDIKPGNILISQKGCVKITDFGFASMIHHEQENQKAFITNQVVTLWYRAPELLLGAISYGPAIDIWSVGCVFYDFLRNGEALFKGESEIEVLLKQF